MMIRRLFFLVWLCVQFNPTFANISFSVNSNQVDSARQDYKLRLLAELDKISSALKLDKAEVVYLIPRSKSEFAFYYSCYVSQKTNKSLKELDALFAQSAQNNYQSSLKLYLQLADFMDNKPYRYSRYYTDYRIGIDEVIDNQSSAFCKIYDNYNARMKSEFVSYHDIFCK